MIRLFLLLLAGVLLSSFALAAEPRLPETDDRCPVCGMFVKPFEQWIATLRFVDGQQLFFDGPKDLLRYYFALPATSVAKKPARDGVKDLWVTDYYTSRLLPVAEVWFISGSDVYGPMGPELVPVAGKKTAESFASDHGGKKISAFADLTSADLPD
ncbi:MAG: nitrous oxide reductase accessory protein NosL [Deltaproteobacteria bacterium]|nr:nitrous oxide reductase accessory protein NosL [Deltaproteobacteria bacterium]NCP02914.1 nitrous oxide reductase accessory protein NosL [Deltaproteobacteria bacterium]